MKYALIIGNNKYDDQKLAQLKTPAADSQALAKILDDQTIGSFDEVSPLINQTETRVRRAISTFLSNKKPDDLVLLYFSGHGILDDRGRLYLALKDTQVNLLKATSIPSSFIADEMDSCRSKRQILILDCCHSGAFARGTKGEQKAITETTFEGSGFGRVVLTASDSTQYALEGDQVIKQTELSLFTHFLLEGLKSGEADTNNDGHISLDEWYDYTYGRVISETPKQVPHKWSYNQQGDLIIARNPHVKKRVVELPYELVQALESSFVGIRESAVNELGKYLRSSDPEMVELAISSLKRMREDDSRRISSLAERLLSEFEQRRMPSVVTPGKTVEAVSEPINTVRDASVPSPQKTADIESPSGRVKSRPALEKSDIRTGTALQPQPLNSRLLTWFGWIGIAVLGYAILNPLQNYLYDYGIIKSISILFAILIGVVSAVQWWVFRSQFGSWWLTANIAGGIILGALISFLYEYAGWWGKNELFTILILANCVLGAIFIRKRPQEPKDASSVPSVNPFAELTGVDPRRNLFVMLLSISLALYPVVALMVSNIGDISNGLGGIFWTLLGITSILAGISFFLIKDTPRNFGFVMLAIFLLLQGIVLELFAFAPGSSVYIFNIAGIMSLLSSVYLVSQQETWKHTRYILLSGYLIFVSLVYLGVDANNGTNTFSILSAIFALLAAIFFFLRK